MTVNGFEPQPSAQTTRNGDVVLTFDSLKAGQKLVFWSYFQVNNVPTVKKIDVSNSLLYDNFNQEINIMHASVGGVKKSTRLDYPASAASFEF